MILLNHPFFYWPFSRKISLLREPVLPHPEYLLKG